MTGKNLIDTGETIQNEISYIENHGETIISIEMNKYTQDYLKSKNIYGFKSYISGNIPIVIKDNLMDLEIKFNRETNIKSTEYEPYSFTNECIEKGEKE